MPWKFQRIIHNRRNQVNKADNGPNLPVLLLLIPILLPLFIDLPTLLEKAENSIGIVITQTNETDPVRIIRVAPYSPADHAGLKPGMELIEAMGQPIHTLEDVGRAWAQREHDQLLSVRIRHTDGSETELGIKPGVIPDFSQVLFNMLGGFYFIGLIALIMHQWKNPQASVLILLLFLLSTDFILPYDHGGPWETWLWRFNLFNLIMVNLLILHFFLLFPQPLPAFKKNRSLFLLLIYGLLLPLGFFLAAQVQDPTSNQSSFPVYTMDTTLAIISWALLTLRTWQEKLEPDHTLSRWVWLFFTPFVMAKLIWHAQSYLLDSDFFLPVDSLVQTGTILAPTGIFLAVVRMDYLQAGQRIHDRDLHRFLMVMLFLLGLILANELFYWVLGSQPELAVLSSTLAALLLGLSIPVFNEPLRNWMVRGIFSRPDLLRRNIDHFFQQQMEVRDDAMVLENACFFLKKQFRLSWVAIRYCNQTDDPDEMIAITQPIPFPAHEYPHFLAGMERITQAGTVPDSEWADRFQVEYVLPVQGTKPCLGQVLIGRNEHPLSSHQQQDIQRFMQRLLHLLERMELEKTAEVDALTATLRREAGLARLQHEISQAIHKKRPLAIALVDLDHFKQINDQHGHTTGDQVLSEVTRVMRQQLRQSDFICRYGGEEFLLVFPGTNLQGAQGALEKLLQAVRNHYIPIGKRNRSLHISISAGAVVVQPEDIPQKLNTTRLANSLIEQADRLLYQAKESGRNRFFCQLWNPPR